MECIGSDQDAGQVLDLVQKGREHGDLIGLAVHADLGQDHPTVMVQASQQVRCPVDAVMDPRPSQRLAIHGQHPPVPGPAPAPLGQLGTDPVTQGLVQAGRVHRGQHPPDRHPVRRPRAKPQRRTLSSIQIGGPLRDPRIGTGSGDHRAHRHRQHRHQPVPHPTPSPRIRHRGQRLEQATDPHRRHTLNKIPQMVEASPDRRR
jgi:hypothetical protein